MWQDAMAQPAGVRCTGARGYSSSPREDWLALIDFSTLEKQGGSYVTDDLREREDDIIWCFTTAQDAGRRRATSPN